MCWGKTMDLSLNNVKLLSFLKKGGQVGFILHESS